MRVTPVIIMKTLHLGCGRKKQAGAIGVDIAPLPGVDIVHDISQGLPFEDNTFRYIIAEHILEHLDVKSFNYAIEEIFRVAKNKAIVKIIVPHYSGRTAWIDPSHQRGFSVNMFDFYYALNPVFDFYTKAKFAVLAKKMIKNKAGIKNKFLDIIYNSIFINAVNYIANQNTSLCENVWCYLIGGFDLCYFKLQAIKKNEKCRQKN